MIADDECAYVGIKNGTVRAIVVDDTRYPEDTAKLVADWIKMGRSVERMSIRNAVARMKSERQIRAPVLAQDERPTSQRPEPGA